MVDKSRRDFISDAGKVAAGGALGAGATGAASSDDAPEPRGLSTVKEVAVPAGTRVNGSLTYHESVYMPVINVSNIGDDRLEFVATVQFLSNGAPLVSEEITVNLSPGESFVQGFPCDAPEEITSYRIEAIV